LVIDGCGSGCCAWGGRSDDDGQQRGAPQRANDHSLFPTKFSGVTAMIASAWAGSFGDARFDQQRQHAEADDERHERHHEEAAAWKPRGRRARRTSSAGSTRSC
jgi:hypothetical protein